MTAIAASPIKQADSLKMARKAIINEAVCPWIHAIGGEARSVLAVAKPYFRVHETVHRAFAATQFTSALTMPLSLYGIMTGVYDLATDKGKQAAIDNSLDLVGDVSDLVDGAMTFTSALAELSTSAASAMVWAGPLALAASLASSVFFAIHGRGLYYCNRIQRELSKTTPAELPALIRKEAYHFTVQCNIKSQFVETIMKRIVRNSPSPADKEQRLTKVIEALKKRVQHKRISHALGIVITAIGIIASVILFATGVIGWGIAASALLGVMFIFSMAKMAFEIHSHRQFKKSCQAAARPIEKVKVAAQQIT